MKRVLLFAAFAGLLASPALTQQVLSLDQVLQKAREASIQSLLSRNEFLEAYWNFKMYKAEQLPNLSMNLAPLSYNKSFTQIYNVVDDRYEYRETYLLASSSSLSMTQNIGATGGTVSLASSLFRVQNLSFDNDQSYTSVPFIVSYNQPLFAHNPYKWDKIIEPRKYEQAKRELIRDLQELNVEAVERFYLVAGAQNRLLMARAEVAAADTLLRIGRTRQTIADIDREELLNLELNHSNATIKFVQAREALRKAKDDLRLFIGLEAGEEFDLLLPGTSPPVDLPPADALELARMFNPEVFNLEIDRLEARKESDKAVKAYRFHMNMDLSYGLNQSGAVLADAYASPLDRQMAQISLQVPILDWGRRKQAVSLARSQEEIVNAQSRLSLQNIEQEVMSLAYQYALRDMELQNTALADSIAGLTYHMTVERFRNGEAGITELDNAQTKKDNARQQYLSTQEKYWTLFYRLQSTTLFDLRLRRELDVDVDAFLETK
ncbi:MAG: TolC family protein [Bacteroidales bacterium]